ncbi:Hypothetical predicted protein [Cloeon dipterum]|uniref:PCI domain-containing protein n=1 Tax=Cloeon dipterum TaxID=197152 RepID=A0A8S1E2U2_9INSE|nr:Hypothetical predicted protein [Cloeon dipterum]
MATALLLERAEAISSIDTEKGISIYKEIVWKLDPDAVDEESIRIKEQGILQLGELFKKEKKAKELGELIKATRPFLALISKAKAAKLVRSLVDMFLDLEAGIGIEVPLCLECIEWAKQEKRTFLRQSLEARLVALYFDTKMYTEALHLGSTLLKELKKLDDKNLLVEVQLLESKTYHALSNLPKARAALTSARTTANSIYCAPKMQAALDLQSGVLHAADERDFKTAYSYFYEAFEGYDSVESGRALTALKYMLLSKIMLNTPDDVANIVSGKLALKYAGRHIDAMKMVATSSHKRSLADFKLALEMYGAELKNDPIVRAHLDTLYDTMLEQNLCRIIEPYSRVQVDFIAKTIALPMGQVEKKLSQMILDKKFHGILDQGEGVLVVFEETPVDKTFESSLETIHSMGKVVDSLYHKAKKLSAETAAAATQQGESGMAEGNGEPKMDQKEGEVDKEPHSEDHGKLIEYGLDEKVASKLDEIYKTGKLAHADLDERALDALKEFPVDGALNVLTQFLDSNLEHVSNKSAFLCGVMKTYRQKSRAGQTSQVPSSAAKAPDEDKIRAILDRTGYTLDVTTGQRKYGGPPPNWEKPTPGNGCEVFCGKIPRDMYEDELIPLFEKCGVIWDLRLMMDPMTGQNRGYAFVTFTTRDAAQQAVRELNDYEIRKGKKIGVTISYNNHRLFVGNIPKNRDRDELLEEFTKHAPGLTEVIIYSSPDDKKKNRGFCFLEYESHKAASLAKRRLGTGRVKVWGCDIIVDWADPQEEPDEETMSKVKVLYVRNLTQDCSEEKLKEAFESFGKVERVKKIKDYAFVHFEDRDQALTAMNELNGKDINGAHIEVSLAKPPSDKKKKEEMLRARERRMMQMIGQRAGIGIGPRGGPGGTPLRGLTRGDYDYDYDYYGYGDYRGGYSDPYFDDYYRYDDYYYDYALHPSAAPRGRGRQPQPAASRGRGVVARGRAGGPPGMPPRGRAAPSRGAPASGAAAAGPPAPPTRGKAGSSSSGAPAAPNQTRGPTTAAGQAAKEAAKSPAGPSLPGEDGKRKFDGGHQNQGDKEALPDDGGRRRARRGQRRQHVGQPADSSSC